MNPREERKKESAGKKIFSLVFGALAAGVIGGGLAVFAAAYLFSPEPGLNYDPIGMGAPSSDSRADRIFILAFALGATGGAGVWAWLWMEANAE